MCGRGCENHIQHHASYVPSPLHLFRHRRSAVQGPFSSTLELRKFKRTTKFYLTWMSGHVDALVLFTSPTPSPTCRRRTCDQRNKRGDVSVRRRRRVTVLETCCTTHPQQIGVKPCPHWRL